MAARRISQKLHHFCRIKAAVRGVGRRLISTCIDSKLTESHNSKWIPYGVHVCPHIAIRLGYLHKKFFLLHVKLEERNMNASLLENGLKKWVLWCCTHAEQFGILISGDSQTKESILTLIKMMLFQIAIKALNSGRRHLPDDLFTNLLHKIL